MQRQNGIALMTALVFLVVLTILGLAAMRSTTMQERMSGNLRDQGVATQAAEAALRDARADLSFGAHANGRNVTASSFPATGTSTDCVKGLCGPATVATRLSELTTNLSDANKYAVYGEFSGAGALPGLSLQPRYVMELLPTTLNAKLSLSSVTATAFYVRITAQGYGLNSDTVVRLEETVLVELDS